MVLITYVQKYTFNAHFNLSSEVSFGLILHLFLIAEAKSPFLTETDRIFSS